jgi:hydrogenase maturation protease
MLMEPLLMNASASFNPEQVLGVAATTDTSHHTSIADERTQQGLVFPDNVCWLCTEHQGEHKAQPLLIGIGNPLRSDDGLGWAVAEQLSQDGDTDCNIHTVHQLTPELAEWMAKASLVVMIDASSEGSPGELRIRPVSHSAQPAPVGTHHTTPEELAALTVGVYGHCPPVVVVTMTGADFSIGEQFSAVVARRIPLVSAVVHKLRETMCLCLYQ